MAAAEYVSHIHLETILCQPGDGLPVVPTASAKSVHKQHWLATTSSLRQGEGGELRCTCSAAANDRGLTSGTDALSA